jgi:hypothetical protein
MERKADYRGERDKVKRLQLGGQMTHNAAGLHLSGRYSGIDRRSLQ